MDQKILKTLTSNKVFGHISKFKHVYIYAVSIVLVAVLLFGAFNLDMMRTASAETENPKAMGYIRPIGMDLDLYEEEKRAEIRNEYQKQLNKESAFLMLITLSPTDQIGRHTSELKSTD